METRNNRVQQVSVLDGYFGSSAESTSSRFAVLVSYAVVGWAVVHALSLHSGSWPQA